MRSLISFGLGIAVAAAVSSAALASDLPRKAAYNPSYYTSTSVYNWDGFYVGGNVGYGWMRSSANNIGDNWGTVSGSSSGSGFTGGITAGYNFVIGRVLAGIEGDVNFGGIGGASTATATYYSVLPVDTTVKSSLGTYATLRGRLGYLVTDRLLAYGTGGLMTGKVEDSVSSVLWAYPQGNATATNQKTGWTAGLGVEYAFAPNWTAKVEGLYYNLGKSHLQTPNGFGAMNDTTVDHRGKLIRAGLNFHF
jgi:outer membrane immunogenic protein